jgi:hypothetical protein
VEEKRKDTMKKKKDSNNRRQNEAQNENINQNGINNTRDNLQFSNASNIKRFVSKSTKKTYLNFLKDLEITKNKFITLQLVYLAFTIVMQINIYFVFDVNVLLQHDYLVFMLIFSIIIGILLGGVLIDKIRGKKTPILLTLMFASLSIIIIHVFFFIVEVNIFSILLLIINSFIAGIIFMFFLVAFIQFTTILERGRVLSYLTVFIGIFVFINTLLISVIFIVLSSSITFGISLYFLNKKRKTETPLIYIPSAEKVNVKKEVGLSILKYIVLLAFFGFIVGLDLPLRNLIFIQNDWDIFFIFLNGIILAILTTVTIGIIYDLSGRRTVVSVSILMIAIINFGRLFIAPQPLLELAFSIICALILFMSIPLLISDIAYKANIGKYLAITYVISFVSLLLGLFLRYNILDFNTDTLTSKLLLNAFIDIAAILILFFLVNTKETLSAKEQNWPESLIHLYIIHTSGLLLYDCPFKDHVLGDSDLAAGGLIGSITILNEITKDKSKKIRIIDHGGKLFLFGFNTYKTLVFALVITEELVILRHKLNNFIRTLDKKYPIKSKTLSGIDRSLWNQRIEPIMKDHFERKYFELIDFKND